MASLVPCPHCGMRPKEEFSVKGAALPRPAPDAGAAAWMDYVYLRENPIGRYAEYWHHAGGCRRWLVVERDTRTHEVYGATDAALAKEAGR